jgi:imidazolonepropionase-like amidohydrolase
MNSNFIFTGKSAKKARRAQRGSESRDRGVALQASKVRSLLSFLSWLLSSRSSRVLRALRVQVPLVALFASVLSAPANAQTIAIEGGTVYTISGATLEGATVLIQDGRIVAVGHDVTVPARAMRVDANGKHVTPGFIESGTQIGAVEVGAVAGSVDHTMITSPDVPRLQVRAGFNIADGINPFSSVIPVTRIAGITTAVSRPTGGLISGQGVLLDLDGQTLEQMLIRSPIAIFARVGEGAAQVTGGARGAAMMRLREVLEDARAFAQGRPGYERGQAREYAASRLDLEALQLVLNREVPFVIEAHRASDIRAALRIARDYDLRLVLAGATEGWMLADELAAEQVPVIVQVLQNLPGNFERLGARYENAALLRRAGVQVILTSGDTHNARNLRQEAGNAVAYGLPREEALRAVTLYPARLWGLDDYGSLEPGKVANVVVWDADPLEILTPVNHVFIRGREIPLRSRQTDLRDRYLQAGDRERVFMRNEE